MADIVRIVGIDPGKTGAVALLDGASLQALVDIPIAGKHIDMRRLRTLLDELVGFGDRTAWVIEEIPFMPSEYGQFVKGRDFGRVEGVVSRWEPNPISVRPQVWKKHHGLIKRPKNDSRLLALELWPDASDLLARKKDVDRAEAALIARWAWDTGAAG